MTEDSPSLAQVVGRLEGRMDGFEKAINQNSADMRQLLEAINQAKGGWKTVALLAGVAGAVGAVMAYIAALMGVFPK